MNRAQLVEKAARAIHGYHGCTNSCEFRGCDHEPGRAVAGMVVDAILPQVTTVEELEALPHRSIVVDRSGRPWIKCRNATHWRSPRGTVSAVDLQHFYGRPLTVVWQP